MRKCHTIALILFAMFSILTSSEAQMNMGSAAPFQAPFTHRPMFAQFLNSDFILKGDVSGLSLLDIGKNQVTENHLEGVAVTAMISNPNTTGQVIIGTQKGDVYLCNLVGDRLNLKKLESITKGDLKIVKTIQFHSQDPGKLLLADEKTIALCKMQGEDLTIEKYTSLGETKDLIIFTFPDNLSPEWFLISTTQHGRYRGNWMSGEVVNIPESVLEYGFQVRKQGINYFARGTNQEYLNIQFLTAHPTSIIQHPVEPRTYLASTIGISPLKFNVDSRNYYSVDYLSENTFLTFSIDLDRSNPQRILFTTTTHVHLSEDDGKTWRILEK